MAVVTRRRSCSALTALSSSQWAEIEFPGVLRIDYVRVYQKGDPQIGCDPPSHRERACFSRSLAQLLTFDLPTFTSHLGLHQSPSRRLHEPQHHSVDRGERADLAEEQLVRGRVRHFSLMEGMTDIGHSVLCA